MKLQLALDLHVPVPGRSPRGERGLKLKEFIEKHPDEFKSLPARGAWIEIRTRTWI